uniref:Uncharacterized protein n=2 Tax=Picea TaxID=3328 RepID=A0A101M3Q9_PICGL|nr:hypothetical protein ABT39_MTgene242 [Picea glauca]QHR90124.1 hypothetical protein Q903MT_gene4147 [Picea sitchensis]
MLQEPGQSLLMLLPLNIIMATVSTPGTASFTESTGSLTGSQNTGTG